MAKVAIGTITDLRGSVEVIHADGSRETLEQGAVVYADDAITTGDNASARIEFSDSSTMIIGPEFTATLDKEVYDPGLIEGEAASTQVVLDSSERDIAPSSGHDTTGGGEIVATVETTVGIVEAIDEDGNVRVLQAGDTLYANEILSVSRDGDVSIRLVDGSELALGSGEAARMADLGPGTVPGMTDTGVAGLAPVADIVEPAQIAAIIQEGRDPTQEAAAPAAGETGGSNEGAEFTVIAPSDRAVTPTSGHETHGFELPFNLPEEELFFEEPEPSQPTIASVITPSLTPQNPNGAITGFEGVDNVVYEDGLDNGSDPDKTRNDTGDLYDTFVVNASDGIERIEILSAGDEIYDDGIEQIPLADLAALDPDDANTHIVINTGEGTLTLIGYEGDQFSSTIEYRYTLNTNIYNDEHDPDSTLDGSDVVNQEITTTHQDGPDYFDDTVLIRVFGEDGSSAEDQLRIRAFDDTPEASIKAARTEGDNIVTIDETEGDQADEPGSPDVFSGLTNTSDDLPTPQYARNAERQVDAGDSVFGADQDGGTKVLSLAIEGGDGTDSGLETTAGTQIFLYNSGDLIVGRIGTETGGSDTKNPDGEIAFAIAIDADSGYVSTALYASLKHPVPGNGTEPVNSHDEPVDLTGKINAVVTLTDGDGDSDAASIDIGGQIQFRDDGLMAVEDTNSVEEGGSVSGNVLTDGLDVFGADGKDPLGGVVGVRAADGNTMDAVLTGTGTTITGLYGELELNANGVYTYTSTPDRISNDVEDVFVYTIKDGDGDLSTTTLTIGVTNVGLEVADDGATVNEAGLDGIGSEPGTDSEIDPVGAITVTGGTGPYTYELTGSATGAYGTLTLNADGSYSYKLTSPFTTDPAVDDGTNTEKGRDSFDYKVTDAGGNETTGTIFVDIIDDIPFITKTTAVVPTLTVDETVLATDDEKSFAGLFNAPVYGADGAATTDALVYRLGVSTDGADSGVVDTLTGNMVFLFKDGDEVVGKEGTDATDAATGETVFTVSVDTAGVVKLDQARAVVHDDPADPDEADGPTKLSAANLVTLTATVTDGDGDTASETVNIGDALNFEDDGPSIARSTAETPDLTVDETVLATDDEKSFAGLFNAPVYGADGEATTDALVYSLGVSTDGVDSGVVDTLTGNMVFLFKDGDEVVGKEGTDATDAATGETVFTVSVDTAGVVKLDQARAVVHDDPADPDEADGPTKLSAANLVTLTATVTDGDGDTASETVNIGDALNFEDDGPSIARSTAETPDLTVDETVLATDDEKSFAGLFNAPVYGADGEATTDALVYSLGVSTDGVDSGVVDTLTGNMVFLFKDGDEVVGKEGTDATDAATGETVFTVSVDTAGVVKLDQARAVVHDDPADPDEADGPTKLSAANLVTLTATVTDGDGDTASETVNIGDALNFEDDGPSIARSTAETPDLTVDETVLATDDEKSFAGLFNAPVYGADGEATTDALVYSLGVSTDGVDSGVVDTLTGNMVFLFKDGDEVVGKEGTDATDAATGETVFTVSVDTAGVVKLDQARAVVHDDPADPDEADGPTKLSAANLVTLTATVTDGDGDTASETVNIGDALNFEDDGPVAKTGVTAKIHVDEDELSKGDGDLVDGITDDDGQTDEATFTDAALQALVNSGADAPLTFSLNTAVSGNVVTTGGDAVTSGGVNVVYSVNGGVIEGKAGADVIFTLTDNGDKTFTFDLMGQMDHSGINDDEEVLTLDLTGALTGKDADLDAVTLNAGSIQVEVENDIPTAGPVENQGKGQEFANTNLMLILDVSSSMLLPSGFQDLSRLKVMIKSSLELLEQYESFGDIKVNITDFSTRANSSGWVNVAEAKIIILNLQDAVIPRSLTNYDDALNDAWSSFLTAGKIPDAQNISYFLSDGNPTENTVDGNLPGDPFGNLNGIDASEQAAWEGFLKANQIKSYALGMGKDVDLVNLEPVSYDGIKDEEIPAILVENFADLETTLVSTVVAPALSGDLLGASDSNALIGADEDGWVQSITVYDSNGLNPVVYSYDQNTDTESVTGGPANGVFNPVTNTWAMNTAAGGVLEVDMNTGEYLYEPPAPLVAAVTEVFDYTIVDSDGDAATSTLTLIEDPAVGAAVVRDDFVITNQDPVDIPDAALLANDTPANGSQQQVIGVTAPATDNPDDTVTLGGPDGSFEYTNESTNTSGSTTDTGKVDVDFVTGSILNGGFLDEILIGGSGNETMNGGAGNDVLVAGSGDNILSGGEGDDTFLSMAGDTGTNTISDFKASAVDGGTEEDVLDISDLLVGEEGLNHSTDELLALALDGDYISIATGTNTTIKLYSDGDGNGGLNPTPDQVIELINFDTTAFAGNSAAVIESLLSDNLITD